MSRRLIDLLLANVSHKLQIDQWNENIKRWRNLIFSDIYIHYFKFFLFYWIARYSVSSRFFYITGYLTWMYIGVSGATFYRYTDYVYILLVLFLFSSCYRYFINVYSYFASCSLLSSLILDLDLAIGCWLSSFTLRFCYRFWMSFAAAWWTATVRLSAFCIRLSYSYFLDLWFLL